MHIGDRIRRRRLELGLTQKVLGEPLYTHAYVSTIEAGRRNPSPKALKHFARKLELDTEQLRTGRPPDLALRLELSLQEAASSISRGEFSEVEKTLSRAERQGTRFGLVRVVSRARELRATMLERRGKLEEAVDLYDSALSVLDSEAPSARAFATAGKARCLQFMGEGSYAIYMLEALVAVLRREQLEDPSALLQLLAPLVVLYYDAGLHERAAEAASEVETLAPHAHEPALLGTMHVNVARRYLAQAQYNAAERSLARAEDAFRAAERRSEIGVVYLALGIVLIRKDQLPRARRRLEEAREIFAETKNALYDANALAELGRVERLLGDRRAARALLEEAVAQLGPLEDSRTLAWAHRELAQTLLEDDQALAEKHLREALLLYERSQAFIELAATHRVMGDLLSAGGKTKEACHAYRAGVLAAERTL